jgi:hypothetical protein
VDALAEQFGVAVVGNQGGHGVKAWRCGVQSKVLTRFRF